MGHLAVRPWGDFEDWKKRHREVHTRILESLDLTEEQVPYAEPAHCRHFDGPEDCPFSCMIVFGDRFVTVNQEG
jgi:hypothetical protein